MDTGGAAASACGGYGTATGGTLPGIAAAVFCSQYMSTCNFAATARYTNMQDCMTKYDTAAVGVKGCRAYHLCNANAGMGLNHCEHAAGLGGPAACQ